MCILARAARAVVAAALIALLGPGIVWAQAGAGAVGPALAPGTRVRVSTLEESGRARKDVGTLVSLTADTLVARWDRGGSTTPVARYEVARLEVSRGMQRQTWRGAGAGFLIGAVVGAVTGAAASEDCEPDAGPCLVGGGSESEGALGGALLVGGGGALIGAIVGTLWRAEGWRDVPAVEVGVRGAPTGRGLALTARFGF